MTKVLKNCSISLGPKHKQRLVQLRKRIHRALREEYPGKSEAIQVALLGFNADEERIRELVKENRCYDHRRSSK